MDSKKNIANPFGGGIWYKERTGSTMDDAIALVVRGEGSGSVAWAGVQDAGRGRFSDRKWEAASGESLLFTLALLEGTTEDYFPLSLRIALALSNFLDSYGIKSQVKWPNDILVNEKKISGILVIGMGNWKYIGIGLNLVQRSFTDGALRRPATSLLMEGITMDAHNALETILPFLYDAIYMKGAEVQNMLERRLWRLGEETEIIEQPGASPRQGKILGLDHDGALLMENKTGLVRCVSGE